MTPTTWFLCSGLAISIIGLFVVVLACCVVSGRAAQWEEDELGIRRS